MGMLTTIYPGMFFSINYVKDFEKRINEFFCKICKQVTVCGNLGLFLLPYCRIVFNNCYYIFYFSEPTRMFSKGIIFK